jgi:hypothetical protein
VKAVGEHARIATSVATALLVLALIGVDAGRALSGAQPAHGSGRDLRIADTLLAQLRQQLHTSEAQVTQLRGQVATLTAQLARSQPPHHGAPTSTHVNRRTARH